MPRNVLLFLPLMLAATSAISAADATFGSDRAFLQKHLPVVVLVSADRAAQVVVAPGYQGRVMTSTAAGDEGLSFGWINRALIASGEVRPHINAFGGEDRLWLGPEGGPYSLFFAPDAPAQTLEHWFTPAVLDTQPWKVETTARDAVTLSAHAVLKNRRGTALDIAFTRTVALLERARVAQMLAAELPADLKMVAYESDNRIRNNGAKRWTRENGLPSIWILGMFKHGPRTTVVIPLRQGGAAGTAQVRSDYFGPLGPDRLRVTGRTVFFRADGESRGKIGLPPALATPIAGSWDAQRGVLTLVHYDLPEDATTRPYVDSRWIDMPDPYAGDVINAYNDGPPAPGVPPFGPFYEIESSSPAAELAPGETLRHCHRTIHLHGPRESLDRLARAVLGVSLREIEAAFGQGAG